MINYYRQSIEDLQDQNNLFKGLPNNLGQTLISHNNELITKLTEVLNTVKDGNPEEHTLLLDDNRAQRKHLHQEMINELETLLSHCSLTEMQRKFIGPFKLKHVELKSDPIHN